MFYPVWGQIAQLANGALRVAMYTTQGEELAALQRAFPACFSENQADICVPASVLQDIARKFIILEGSSPAAEGLFVTLWAEAARSLGVPIAFTWSGEEFEEFEEATLVPPEVWEQLKGKSLLEPQSVTYLGERFVVVGGYAAFGDTEDDDRFCAGSEVYSMEAIHERFIALGA